MQYSVLSESQRTAHASWTEACAQLRRGEGAGRDGCAGAVHGLAKARLLDYAGHMGLEHSMVHDIKHNGGLEFTYCFGEYNNTAREYMETIATYSKTLMNAYNYKAYCTE